MTDRRRWPTMGMHASATRSLGRLADAVRWIRGCLYPGHAPRLGPLPGRVQGGPPLKWLSFPPPPRPASPVSSSRSWKRRWAVVGGEDEVEDGTTGRESQGAEEGVQESARIALLPVDRVHRPPPPPSLQCTQQISAATMAGPNCRRRDERFHHSMARGAVLMLTSRATPLFLQYQGLSKGKELGVGGKETRLSTARSAGVCMCSSTLRLVHHSLVFAAFVASEVTQLESTCWRRGRGRRGKGVPQHQNDAQVSFT